MTPLILLGPSGVGKSVAAGVITNILQTEHGIDVACINSKEILGGLVLDHVRGLAPDAEGHVVTDHVTLLNPDRADATSFQADFHGGLFINRTHEGIIGEVATRARQGNTTELIVAELANGRTVFHDHGEPTRQSVSQFIDWMEEYGILDASLVLHITAPFNQRAEQNRNRPGRIPEGPYKLLYEFDDLTESDVVRFGDKFTLIDNNGIPEIVFLDKISDFTRNTLVPRLHIEGNRQPPEQNRGYNYGPEQF